MFVLFVKRLLRSIMFLPENIKMMFCDVFESCYKCGRTFNALYHIKDGVWNNICKNKDVVLCPECFHREAEKNGYAVKQSVIFELIRKEDITKDLIDCK